MANIQDIFSFRNISTAIESVKTGIPDRLPSVFNTITEKVFGNETTYHKFFGQRKLVQRTEYGAPSKGYSQNPVTQQPVILTSFNAHVTVEQELLLRLRNVNDLMAQQKAMDFIERKARELKTRFENNRIAHKIQMLRKGAYWYDSSGNLLQSSSGAVATVDFGVPAGNQGQVSSCISATWATTSTNIYGDIIALDKKAIQATGRPLKHFFYGNAIPTYIYKNDSFKHYFQFNPQYFQAFANKPGYIPDGFMGKTWHHMGDVFFENESGTVVQGWDDDILAMTPEIDSDVYTMFEGSKIVPTGMGVQTGETVNLGNTELVHGIHGYSVMTVDPIQVKLIIGDEGMPVWKNAADLYIADVVP